MSNACAETIPADQAEFPFDDPRIDEDLSARELYRLWKEATALHGDLVTRAFAAALLGCSTSQVSVWATRGRLSDVAIGPVRMVPIREVLALWNERAKEGIPVGGRGKKAPSMFEAVRASVKIFGD